MYNVLIVDDEPIICQGLRSKIKRINNPNIKEIWECYDSKTAITLVEEKSPDIIITDVEMPGMNGLELIKNVIGLNISCKCIVLSGYDKFNYVREAFKNGAVDYMLKPVSISDLTERLNATITVLEKQRDEVLYRQEIEKVSTNEQVKFLLEKALEMNSVDESIGMLESLFPYNYVIVSILSSKDKHHGLKSKELIYSILEGATKIYYQETELRSTYFYDDTGDIVYILNLNQPKDFTRIKSNLEYILQGLTNEGLIYKCGFYHNRLMKKEFHENYLKAKEALRYSIFYKANSVIHYDMIREKSEGRLLEAQDMHKLKSFITHKNYYKLSEYIDKSFTEENLKDVTISSIEGLYKIILRQMNSLVNNYNLENIEPYSRNFYDFSTLQELRIYLKQCIIFIQQQAADKEGSIKSVVDIAIEYVKENYSKEITMLDISKMVSMNYSYFSKLFKEYTGVSFKKYLIKVRMEQAKVLLCDPTLRIQEVGLSVGYDNPQNFSRAFKSLYALTPKEWRQKGGGLSD